MIPDDLRVLLEPAGGGAIITDFDGVLAPIVPGAADARPVEGARAVLDGLALRYRTVAVVSGRPASFLVNVLGNPGTGGVRFIGLYGMEEAAFDGQVMRKRGTAALAGIVDAIAADAQAAGTGADVEHKGLTVTIHWRVHPEVEQLARDLAARLAVQYGFGVRSGKMSLELVPRNDVDKGTVVSRLVMGMNSACYIGDDIGDIAAVDALRFAAMSTGMRAVVIAVGGDETPVELIERADLCVDSPDDVVAMLRACARP